jgi:uroporphyrin-III C-methyltransferase/precorrin-2 dehydrogenase/sirohydrochlorin ferrochelatase
MANDNTPSDREEPQGPRYTTLGINLAGRRCLVVGGGRIGSRKAATLADGGAEVTVVAPAISAALEELVAAGRVRWLPSGYDAGMLPGAVLVVAATADEALNLRIAADAAARGILCCNVSSASRSEVIFPALLDDDEITVAVHSHGRKCGRSKQFRDEIAAWLREKER